MSRSRHFISLTEKLTLSYLLVSLLITFSMAVLIYFALNEASQDSEIQKIKTQHGFLCSLIEQALRANPERTHADSVAGFAPNLFRATGKNIFLDNNAPKPSLALEPDSAEGYYKMSEKDSSGSFSLEISLPDKTRFFPKKTNIYLQEDGEAQKSTEYIARTREGIEIVTQLPFEDKILVIKSLYKNNTQTGSFPFVLKFVLIGILISGLIFMYAYFTGRKIAQPLRELTEAAGKTQSGNFPGVNPPQVNDEVGQLAEAFNQMASRLKKQSEELEKERIRRLKSIIDSQELERKRVAKELHEGLAQDLVGLKFMINRLSRIDNLDKLKDQLPQMEKYADNMVEQIRVLSNKLSPTVLSGYGLGPALRFLAEESQRVSGINITIDTSGLPARIGGKMKTYLYRIVQETLQNSMAQRSVRNIEVTFATDITRLYIFVQDDGQGFPEFRLQNPGYGVYSMQERIELLGGNLRIESEAGRGTRVTIGIPLRTNTES